MSELPCLELSVVLWLIHVIVQASFARAEFGDDFQAGARDVKPTPKRAITGRAHRALHNYLENYPAFIAVDLALIATQHTGGWGATIWIIARIVYLPLYLSGVKYVRTLCWIISIVGLLMMLARLAGY